MIDPKITKLAASRGVGAMIVAHILKDNESFSTRGRNRSTYCNWNGESRYGEKWDHSRPDQPATSSAPQKQAVGMSHFMR